MKKSASFFVFAAFALFAPELSAALSKEPVIITNCRSFGARADAESKTGLASRFVESVEGDCDDINKVSENKIISVSGIMEGKSGVFSLEALYPDGHSYKHFIMLKVFKNTERNTELWMASSPDFARSTYAIAESDTDKIRPLAVIADSSVAPSIIPAILYSFGRDMVAGDASVSRKNSDLGLIQIYESIVGGSKGFTSEFVQGDDWQNEEKRAEALKALRDYTVENLHHIKIDNSLDPDGKTFVDYMKIYSDEFVKSATRAAELKGKQIQLEKFFVFDEAALQLAKKALEKQELCPKKSKPKSAGSCGIPSAGSMDGNCSDTCKTE